MQELGFGLGAGMTAVFLDWLDDLANGISRVTL